MKDFTIIVPTPFRFQPMKIKLMTSVLASLLGLSTALASVANAANAWLAQDSGTQVELRGLSVLSPQLAWASGAKGTVLKTTDGEHWQAMQVAGAESLDFRDIQAFDAKHAIIMSAGPGSLSRIYQTTDGGGSWQLLKTNEAKTGFWNAMTFFDKRQGILFGDPVDGNFQVLMTADAGLSWHEQSHAGLTALANEGGFAASGTCISSYASKSAWIVSGGAEVARVFSSHDQGQSWFAATLPIPAAAPSKGAFSVAFLDEKNGMAVGGDYKLPQLATINGARTEDGGKTWLAAQVLPQGFMSVITTIPGAAQTYIAAGLAGSGISHDAGKTWQVIDSTPVNTVAFADARHGWAIGPKGILLKFQYGAN